MNTIAAIFTASLLLFASTARAQTSGEVGGQVQEMWDDVWQSHPFVGASPDECQPFGGVRQGPARRGKIAADLLTGATYPDRSAPLWRKQPELLPAGALVELGTLVWAPRCADDLAGDRPSRAAEME
jgi:hypothetical protein